MQSELSDSAWQHLTAFLSHCSFPCREVAAFPLPHATAEEGSERSLEQKWDQESGMLNLPGMCLSHKNSHKDGPCHWLKTLELDTLILLEGARGTDANKTDAAGRG